MRRQLGPETEPDGVSAGPPGRAEAGKTTPFTPYSYTHPDDPGREDEGLFGPGSVTWRLMNSRIMWVAVLRALYLQALHPRVIRGTLQNAATITEPVRRGPADAAADLPPSGARRRSRAETGDAAGQRPGLLDPAPLGTADVRQARRAAERGGGDRRAAGHPAGVRPAAAVRRGHAGRTPRRISRPSALGLPARLLVPNWPALSWPVPDWPVPDWRARPGPGR